MLNGEGEKKERKGWEKREREGMRREGGRKRERNGEKNNFALFSCTAYFLTPKYPPAQTWVPTALPDLSTFILFFKILIGG